MKTALAFAIALSCGIGFGPAPARAASPQPQAGPLATDLAAAKKHRKRHHYYSERPVEIYGSSGYVSDPSIGYYPNLRHYQAMGRCVIDLGYGRYRLCN
jgi:hypothetical protein